MRIATALLGAIAVLAAAGLVIVEALALRLATDAARSAVEHCVSVEDIEVTSVSRPAVLGLLQGEVRDVRVRAEGIRAGDLRIASVSARLPVAPAGWGNPPETLLVVADVTIEEADLERYLVAASPELATPTLEIVPDGLRIGDQRVPFDLELLLTIGPEGGLQLVPTLGDPRLWSSLGLELDVDVPPELELIGLDLRDGSLVVSGRVEVATGVDRRPACPDIALLGAPSEIRSGWPQTLPRVREAV